MLQSREGNCFHSIERAFVTGRLLSESMPESSGAVLVERFAHHSECRKKIVSGATYREHFSKGILMTTAVNKLGLMPRDTVTDAGKEQNCIILAEHEQDGASQALPRWHDRGQLTSCVSAHVDAAGAWQ